MTPTDVETVYEALAQKLDQVGEAYHPLYLTKLALLLAQELDDAGKACALIDGAAQHLDA